MQKERHPDRFLFMLTCKASIMIKTLDRGKVMNKHIKTWFDRYEDQVTAYSKKLWEHAEPMMEEYFACEETAAFLEEQGFTVEVCHCTYPERKPNTVVASFGSGHPVVAVFGEYDALPDLGQDTVPYRSVKPGCGHGCGHNLMAASAISAACAAKAAVEQEGLKGTIRFLACPAEEGGNGKLYMQQLGLFDGIDCLIGWHADDGPLTGFEKMGLSIEKIVFTFTGKASHAAKAPEMGRSSMDAAELMSVGVQYLREHISSDCRIHHSYLETISKANIVPEHSSVYYVIRAKDLEGMYALAERVIKIAQGAAMMTETQLDYHIESALPGTLIVTSFTKFLCESAQKIPDLTYSQEEEEFAKEIYKSVFQKEAEGGVLSTDLVQPDGVVTTNYASTDLGYITYLIPTGRLVGLGMVKKTPVHHWALTCTAGMSIGQKAAVYVGKCLAQALVDMLHNPEQVTIFKQEHEKLCKGQNFKVVMPK